MKDNTLVPSDCTIRDCCSQLSPTRSVLRRRFLEDGGGLIQDRPYSINRSDNVHSDSVSYPPRTLSTPTAGGPHHPRLPSWLHVPRESLPGSNGPVGRVHPSDVP